MASEQLPPEFMPFGHVVGRVIRAVGDTDADPDSDPEAIPVTGTGLVRFTPLELTRVVTGAVPSTWVQQETIAADLDSDGFLALSGARGLLLWPGAWKVSAGSAAAFSFPAFTIEVTSAHTADAPLDLWTAAPYSPPAGATVTTLVVPAGAASGQILGWDDSGLSWLPSWGQTIQSRQVMFDIRDFGAAVDGKVLTDVSVAQGDTVLTSPTYTFTSADVGKVIGISGAGAWSANYGTQATDGAHVTRIASVQNGAAVLADPAVNVATKQTCCFGTPDDAAFAAAQTAASAVSGIVYMPPGRSIVTKPLPLLTHVTWAGAGRDISWVEVIKSEGADAPFCWLYKAPPYPILEGIWLHDFAVEARYQIRPSGYTAALKPLNFWAIHRAIVERVQCRNFPATALPFDACQDGVVIRDNLIINPGRLWPSNDSGGSGIGIGTSREPYRYDYIVEGNSIIGVGRTDFSPFGNNGIFIEAQDAPEGDNAGVGYGFRVTGNYVQGMTRGIAENGAAGTVIAHNQIVDCVQGINVSKGGVALSFSGKDTLVQGNYIMGWSPRTGITSSGITISAASARDFADARVLDNTIRGRTGYGILVLCDPSANMTGVEISRNRIADITLCGIRIGVSGSGATIGDLTISGNTLTNVGSTNTTSDNSGIRLEPYIVRLSMVGNVVKVGGAGGGLVGFRAISGGVIIGNSFGLVSGTLAPDPSMVVIGNTGWAASIPTVTGSKTDGTALTSLLAALASQHLINNTTS